MTSVTLSVTVNGGIPPATIQVRFFSPSAPELDISSPKSFSHTFPDLTPGLYDIFIVGMNPAGGNTVCAISPDPAVIVNPPDPSPTVATGSSYVVQFHLKVN